MKLNAINYTRPSQNYKNTENNNYSKKNAARPSFGNLAVGLASFIENNGFLGEFLTIDSVGMMIPRTAQGYARNREELGHLNYKAGREELVRELLSGPAYFYVPLAVLTLVGIVRGKTAKVQTKVLNSFKSVMENTAVELKNAAQTKTNFVKRLLSGSFKGYKNETGLIDEIEKLMNKNLTEKLSFSDKVSNLFKNKANKKATPAMVRADVEKLVTKLNKANGKHLDDAGSIDIEGVSYSASSLLKDMENYLDDFTKRAQKTKKDKDTFVEKFHQHAKDLRNATNILAVSALSAFMLLIPKLYQTDKKFPGTEGLNTGETPETTQATAPEKEKEVA